MRAVNSCGVLVFRKDKDTNKYYFLLLKHPKRYDLPKGHRREEEDQMTAALRELREETGIIPSKVNILPNFSFTETYYPKYARFNNAKVEKTLVMFIGVLQDDTVINLTEHKGFEWIPWNPPHKIQKYTIDPLLTKIEEYFKSNPL
eukprot:TRINITY_DN12995_c0_g1_i1.p1 TRINITY_DN12995_c0_g1~~TRINITY_DN12995_c0_g1_i1.p1  ORF type:complete len:167 (+),score=23.00 TRINITY_DN12995_c0_g1_i1:65-502(+)